ncbi:MAG: MFS transporter [Bacteroidia bacterium]
MHDPFEAWRYRDFRFFVSARLALTMGILMQSVIVGWIVYKHTRDPWQLGLIGLIEAIPTIGVALYGGYLADIISRRKIILVAIGVMVVSSGIITYFNFNSAGTYARFGLIPIYIYVAAIGFCRGFLSSAVSAFGAQLVPKSVYPNMSSWNSSAWHLGAVIGPAIGGFLYDYFDAGPTCLCFTLLMAVSFVCYLFIPPKPVANVLMTEPIIESLKQGIRFVFHNKILLGAITLDLFAVLFGDAIALLPAFADKVLHINAHGMGLLRSAPALGAITMAIWLAYNPPLHKSGKKLLFAVAMFGLCMIGFALSTNFYLTFFLLALGGMFDNVSVVIRSTILQTQTPDEMRGRVSSINSIFIGSSNEIGSFVSGSLARIFTLVPSVIIGGIASIGVVGIAAKVAPQLLNYEIRKTDSHSNDNPTND